MTETIRAGGCPVSHTDYTERGGQLSIDRLPLRWTA
jgi:hypothetical protein